MAVYWSGSPQRDSHRAWLSGVLRRLLTPREGMASCRLRFPSRVGVRGAASARPRALKSSEAVDRPLAPAPTASVSSLSRCPTSALQPAGEGPSQRLALSSLELVHAATVRHLSTSPRVPAQRPYSTAAPISGWPRRPLT